jgi:hypothetical protein
MGRTVPVILLVIAISLSGAAQPLSAQSTNGALPAFSYIEASGCEGLFLYAWNDARSEVLTIRVDRSRVKLADGTTTLNLATAGEPVAVQVELTDGRRGTMPFCSEAGQASQDRPAVWVARAGTLKIIWRPRPGALVTPVSVMIDDLVVASPAGAEARSKRTIRFTAAVSDLKP